MKSIAQAKSTIGDTYKGKPQRVSLSLTNLQTHNCYHCYLTRKLQVFSSVDTLCGCVSLSSTTLRNENQGLISSIKSASLIVVESLQVDAV
ncbi:hypothetical protein HanIR_Chr09g0398881 [Helianthus annuus]|nr:hypothetical protein HanIR_Chr09g0398881 [Helianthus annuus]